jgi:hypothetical protein
MSEQNAGLQIPGYVAQSDANVALVSKNKILEEQLLRLLDSMVHPAIDQRWLSIARTHFDQGWMALNRSIFRPTRISGEIDNNE